MNIASSSVAMENPSEARVLSASRCAVGVAEMLFYVNINKVLWRDSTFFSTK